ncbi:hypothetical protein B0H19DRAFT_447940 [Mycena capillaripes]|nr:hypothetical protein B0H19DRAFT_447940 [Mycena capillaripes]
MTDVDRDAEGEIDSAYDNGNGSGSPAASVHSSTDDDVHHPGETVPTPVQSADSFSFGRQNTQPPRSFAFPGPAPTPAPFAHPTEGAFLARAPRHRSQTPHRKSPAYEQTLDGPEDMLARVTFQRNTGDFDTTVIDCKIAVANVAPGFVETLNKKPEQYALISIFLGGAQLFEVYGMENLVADITNTIIEARIAEEDDFEVIPLAADDKNPHAPPILEYLPERRTWTIGLWKVSRVKTENGERLRWVLTCFILSDPGVARAFQKATGGADLRPLLTRLLEFARTIDTRWNPHSKHICAYAKPCTTNSEDWEAVRPQCEVPASPTTIQWSRSNPSPPTAATHPGASSAKTTTTSTTAASSSRTAPKPGGG